MKTIIKEKIERMINGERVVLTDGQMDIIEESRDDVRTLPNPNRCGVLDRWVGWIDKKDLTPA